MTHTNYFSISTGDFAIATWPAARRVRGVIAVLAALAVVCHAAGGRAATARVATFNLALYGRSAGEVLARLERGDDVRIQRLAEIIQRTRPDILVLNEIDYDAEGAVLAAFCENYLAKPQDTTGAADGPAQAIAFPHRLALASNTGEHSGLDLDGNGRVDAKPGSPTYANDCWGYGVYPGQYAFAVLSRFPIDKAAVREFRKFRWKDMPAARLPDNGATPEPGDWLAPEALAQFRLSSKSHCDVPIDAEGQRIHLLLCHPTPPVFDGPEDRNGRRNFDELRFWADYIATATPSGYIIDDQGEPGGLSPGSSFLLLGDLNSDPHDGDARESAAQLLTSPAILAYPFPTSRGAVEAARVQGRANASHQGDPAFDTEDANDYGGPGNLHLDYILPSKDFRVAASGVFWPESSDPLSALVAGEDPPASSDHRLVWVDLAW